MTRRILILGLLASLAACGRKGPVRPPTDDEERESGDP
jgi:predicted small lipoprotein YifL